MLRRSRLCCSSQDSRIELAPPLQRPTHGELQRPFDWLQKLDLTGLFDRDAAAVPEDERRFRRGRDARLGIDDADQIGWIDGRDYRPIVAARFALAGFARFTKLRDGGFEGILF